MEFDLDERINDYLNAEIGNRKQSYQNVFESSHRNFRNIFQTQFPLIEGEINNVRYFVSAQSTVPGASSGRKYPPGVLFCSAA
jgi:hypothetical protein